MRDRSESDAPAEAPWKAPWEAPWEARGPLAASVLAPLAEINDLAVELLATRAAHSGDSMLPPMLAELRELWVALDDRARRRLASCPFLLVDAGFAEAQRWRRGGIEGVAENAGEASPFEDAGLPRLAYLSLTYAWHLARTRPLAAPLVLGMPQASAALLAGMSIRQLSECLARSVTWIRPRWAHDTAFWSYLLWAASSPEPQAFESARLLGVQRIAGTFWPQSSGWRS